MGWQIFLTFLPASAAVATGMLGKPGAWGAVNVGLEMERSDA